MLWLSRKDIEHISRRLLRDYLKKVPQKVDHIDPADFAEKMCGLQFTFADISEAHDAIGLTATSGVIITIPQRDGTRLDYELDGKTAFIDQSLVAENQIGRLNFTMMHEAAHQLFWMLYPEEYEAQTPRCVFRMTDTLCGCKNIWSTDLWKRMVWICLLDCYGFGFSSIQDSTDFSQKEIGENTIFYFYCISDFRSLAVFISGG